MGAAFGRTAYLTTSRVPRPPFPVHRSPFTASVAAC